MRVAIIGAGRMGRRHIEACGRAGYEVVALVDANPETLEQALTAAPTARPCGSADEALTILGLDMVAIATTTVSHCELASQAIRTGVKRVLVEKPLGRSLDECDEVVAIAQQMGAQVAVNHPYRQMSHMRELIDLLRSPEFGGLSSMHIVGGNGGVAMLLAHFVDLFELSTGEMVSRVRANFPRLISPNPRGSQYEDHSAFVVAHTDSGRRLVVDIGGSSTAPQGVGMLVTASGPHGIVEFDMLTGGYTCRVRDERDRALSDTQYMFGSIRTVLPEHPIDIVEGTKNVLKALVADGEYCSLTEARHYVEVLVAAFDSYRTGGEEIDLRGHSFNRAEQFPWP